MEKIDKMVIIPMDHYNQLTDFQNQFLAGKHLIVKEHWTSDTLKFYSTDELAQKFADDMKKNNERIAELKDRNVELFKQIEELKSQLLKAKRPLYHSWLKFWHRMV